MIFLSFDASNPARSRVALKRQFTQMIERSENWRVFNELRSALEANREHLAGIENDLSEKYILNKFREIANHARTREVIVQPDEYFSELYRAIDAAGNGTSVLAVSSFSPKVWSEHPDQQIYLEKNLEAAKRGANIRRIFLQSDSDVFKISAEIGRQLRGNISIRRAPHHLSHLSAGVADFVIFKDDQTGTGRVFIADPSPLNPAQIRRGRIVQDLRDRIWLLERFQSIWDVSPPLQSEEEVVRPTAQNALAPPLNLESKKLSRNVITCAEAAAAKGFELRNELKSIVVQTRMGMVAVHLRGDREVSLRKVKRELGLKEAYLASEEMLARIGLSPGIVSAVKEPLWSMTNLLSASVLELEFVSTNDGTLNGYYVFSPQVLATCPRVIIGDFEELPDQT
jgi:prolyl-tRNA editing enzyme YbaK/EbsC (Cys-tRNA(Pro) deacylase)